ncbi:MAG: 2Fe-2S iron-sulfur cluster-binding protein [Phycisphaerales bacterium]
MVRPPTTPHPADAMPTLTINGKEVPFTPGQNILQAALDAEFEIPHYCYHPGLSVVASCRICLAEVWQKNPKTGDLQKIPKLVPTCQQPAAEGMVVHTDTPKAIANQKSVMEYLLINHPVDCPVCDKAGECHLQDYSYQYGRGQSRFAENKIKQPKKDVGPHILLYSDRCIMCTRCVRFTREVTGSAELIVEGRGAMEQIDVFPGRALDNELSGNVADICPVGALLDKDFLFQQRVWFLERTPSIDGLTASGDNLWVEHHDGQVYRLKPRENSEVNKWWITDEVRYGWKFVHREDRIGIPAVKGLDPFEFEQGPEAYAAAYARANEVPAAAVAERGEGSVGLMASPMLSCEDVFLLASWVRSIDSKAVLAVGPVPRDGEDKTFPGGFTIRAEKAPNARGVRKVLESFGGEVLDADGFAAKAPSLGAAVVTGNYPSDWVSPGLASGLAKTPFVLIDTLPTSLTSSAEVVLPGATWVEKAGSFMNADGRLQSFRRALAPLMLAKSEAQLALDLAAAVEGKQARSFDDAQIRGEIATRPGLEEMANAVFHPEAAAAVEPDMVYVEL